MVSKCNSAPTISAISSSPGFWRRSSPPPGGARIVNLSSDGHRLSDVDLDDPNWEHREYDKFAAYGASKTANILHTVELDRRLRDQGQGLLGAPRRRGDIACAAYVPRRFHRLDADSSPSDPAKKKVDVHRDFTMPEHGAATQVWAAVSDDLADTGAVYLADCRIRRKTSHRTRSTRRTHCGCGMSSERLCAVASTGH